MRSNPFLALLVLGLASTGAVYYVGRAPAVPQQEEVVPPAPSALTPLSVQKPPPRVAHRDYAAPREARQLSRLTEQLATLEARLHSLEATALLVPNPDAPLESDDPDPAQPLSEEAFGQWMDVALVSGAFDRQETRLMREEMETSLADVPGLQLMDLQCSSGFCRASFGSATDTPPNVLSLAGAAPFIESGFTLPAPDGGVSVYFTQPGQSLSELRSDVQEQGEALF